MNTRADQKQRGEQMLVAGVGEALKQLRSESDGENFLTDIRPRIRLRAALEAAGYVFARRDGAPFTEDDLSAIDAVMQAWLKETADGSSP